MTCRKRGWQIGTTYDNKNCLFMLISSLDWVGRERGVFFQETVSVFTSYTCGGLLCT